MPASPSGGAFARCDWRAGEELSRRVKKLRAAFRQAAGVFTGAEHFGQHGFQRPAKALARDPGVELFDHLRIERTGFTVDGEHAGGFAHAHDVFAGEHVVHMAGQCGQAGELGQMRFAVQDGLVQVRNAPALGNVKAQQRGQLFGCGTGHGVAPGAEFAELAAVFVKGQVAMHHGGNAKAGELGELRAVLCFYVRFERGVGILNAAPDVVHMIGPNAVFKAVFPGVVAGGDGRVVRADEDSLDTGGAKLDAQHCAALFDVLLHVGFLSDCMNRKSWVFKIPVGTIVPYFEKNV